MLDGSVLEIGIAEAEFGVLQGLRVVCARGELPDPTGCGGGATAAGHSHHASVLTRIRIRVTSSLRMSPRARWSSTHSVKGSSPNSASMASRVPGARCPW